MLFSLLLLLLMLSLYFLVDKYLQYQSFTQVHEIYYMLACIMQCIDMKQNCT